MWNPISNSDEWGKEESLTHARDLPYYDLYEMELAVDRAHKLWNKKIPMFDTMYMLNILSYGELQRIYKNA
jgi:hypothetical protein|tara:strand:+ start:1509 stop:1721 length:213 start_codon:yes stop_codon:yes gene_type:complete